jgi:hypothetical protein
LLIGDDEITNELVYTEGGSIVYGHWELLYAPHYDLGTLAWEYIPADSGSSAPDPIPEPDRPGSIIGWPANGIVFGSTPAALTVSCVPNDTNRTVRLVGFSRTYDSLATAADNPVPSINEYWNAPLIIGDEVTTGFDRCRFTQNKLVSEFSGISVSNGSDIISSVVGNGAGRAIVSTISDIESVLGLPSGQSCAGPWEDNVIWYGYLAAPKITLF